MGSATETLDSGLFRCQAKPDHKNWCQLIGFLVWRHQQSLTQVGSKIYLPFFGQGN